jgi:diguanylate cyclase (GGDEF)-like protein
LAILISAHAWVDVSPSRPEVMRLLLLCGLCLLFQFASRKIIWMRLRVDDSRVDMTPVWTFAAAVALPPGLALAGALVAVLAGLRWSSEVIPRLSTKLCIELFSSARIILACLSAAYLLDFVRPKLNGVPGSLSGLTAVLIAIAVYVAVNKGLVAGASCLCSRPASWRRLTGSWEDNALEVATLCLGGLAAVAMQYEPSMTVLILVPILIVQRGALIKHLEVAAATDAKTGLLNAATWQQLAQRELSRAAREGQRAAVLILDMDRFKQINDTHGHLVGDVVLKGVADCLTEEMRDYDTIGRFGGEEFVALLPGIDAETAMRIAGRICHRVSVLRVPMVEDPAELLGGLSVSIGVACFPRHGFDVERLLHAADAALYVAKHGGRNRVEIAETPAG